MIVKKVFFGCNLNSLDRNGNQNDYANHIKVAINSCIKNTNLDIHFMHCGRNEELLNWLKLKPIKLIDVSDFDLLDILPNYYKGVGLSIARGAWQRALIPQVCRQLGVTDTHVLYTDIDVIFTSNTERPINLNIDKFACALEQGRGSIYNTGVMIINTAYFDSIYEPLIDFAKSRNFGFGAFDQGALNGFVPKNQITILDHHEWNFAPHMHGDCKQSRIIHFHGPKANQIDFYLKGGARKEFKHCNATTIWNLLNSSNKNTLSLIIDLYKSHLDMNLENK
jgi:lipopolysaccharide biosynthesis glycosyltransferase